MEIVITWSYIYNKIMIKKKYNKTTSSSSSFITSPESEFIKTEFILSRLSSIFHSGAS